MGRIVDLVLVVNTGLSIQTQSDSDKIGKQDSCWDQISPIKNVAFHRLACALVVRAQIFVNSFFNFVKPLISDCGEKIIVISKVASSGMVIAEIARGEFSAKICIWENIVQIEIYNIAMATKGNHFIKVG